MGRGWSENDLERALRSKEDPAPPPSSGVQGLQDPRESYWAASPRGEQKEGTARAWGPCPTPALSCCLTLAEPHSRKRWWGDCCFSHILRAPNATDTPSPPSLPPTMCLTWSSYRWRGQTCGVVVRRTGGSHVSSLGSSLFTWLPRRLREGPPRERTLHLKGPHLEVGWAGRHSGPSPAPLQLT